MIVYAKPTDQRRTGVVPIAHFNIIVAARQLPTPPTQCKATHAFLIIQVLLEDVQVGEVEVDTLTHGDSDPPLTEERPSRREAQRRRGTRVDTLVHLS